MTSTGPVPVRRFAVLDLHQDRPEVAHVDDDSGIPTPRRSPEPPTP